MKLKELAKEVDKLNKYKALTNERVMVRDKEGRLKDILEFNMAIYGNEGILIIDLDHREQI